MLSQIEVALANGDIERLKLLRPYAGVDSSGAGSGPADDWTPHEKYLDRARILVTAALVTALFTAVVLSLVLKSVAASATPYVSLLSGLAGIALGWMFASGAGSGSSSGRSRRPTAASTRSAKTNPAPGPQE